MIRFCPIVFRRIPLTVMTMEPPKAKSRRVVNVAITPRAEQVLARIKQETGITQVGFVERLLEWYAAQDSRIKTMILSPYPEVRRGLAGLVAAEMAADPEKDFDREPRFDALIDHDFTGAAGPEGRLRSGRSRSESPPASGRPKPSKRQP